MANAFFRDADPGPDAEELFFECEACEKAYSVYEDEVNECPSCGHHPGDSDYYEPREFPSYD